ncbi:MAG: threonine transporter [Nitrobacter sp. 62-13]|uniref:LysE family translocator n=1 Tax=Nitrobacter sp. 62-13 TaxID=1895797 RepID=UPI00095E2594|nr:LysE family transporter [Nitrobacter sp. 62-13]OJU23792.1 MAG: threonine transporter [Nitrobacter sp. 62-13]
MSASLALFGILGALLVGAVSPGPSFVLVSRIAATVSRRDGLWAAMGMGLGGAIFAILALLGLATILLRIEWLYLVLRILGGIYLVYLGIQIWRGASESTDVSASGPPHATSAARSLGIGFLTQVCNPKTAVVYASIFAALLPPSTPLWLFLCLPPLVFALEATWYAVVALAFSAPRPRSVYLCSKRCIDRVAGVVMGALGARLISESLLLRN